MVQLTVAILTYLPSKTRRVGASVVSTHDNLLDPVGQVFLTKYLSSESALSAFSSITVWSGLLGFAMSSGLAPR